MINLWETRTPAEKRVALAREVLKQLRPSGPKKLRVRSGVYLRLTEDVTLPGTTTNETQLRKVLPHLPPCQVCAQGALFLACIVKDNRLTLFEAFGSELRPTRKQGLRVDSWAEIPAFIVRGRVEEFFGKEAALIETAFERSPLYVYVGGADPAVDAAVEFGASYPDAKERLRAIMKNIIRNKGSFKP